MIHTMTARRTIGLTLAAAPFLMAGAAVHAQAPAAPGGGIYSCVDAQGRRITADRPIAACIDRPQRELSNSGATLSVVPPTPTATERDAERAHERERALERQRARDAIRRDEALLNRYPNQAAHDEGRKKALAQTQVVVSAAQARIDDLKAERKGLDEEMEFYKKDPSKAPAKVRQAIETNAEAIAVQERAIGAQQAERDRINAAFDEQLALRRVSPLKSTPGLRPWGGAPSSPPLASLRLKLLCEAQASISVPSTLKCSSPINFAHCAVYLTRSKNTRARSSLKRRSRLALKVEWSQTLSSMFRPTNQRYSRL